MIFNNWEANTPRVERCSLKYKALKAELHVIVNETLSCILNFSSNGVLQFAGIAKCWYVNSNKP